MDFPPASSSSSTAAAVAANSGSNKRIKLSCESSVSGDNPQPVTSSKKAKPASPSSSVPSVGGVTIKTDPADLSGRNSSCTDSSGDGCGSSNSSRQDNDSSSGPTELPTDPSKMTDPSKWPAWIFCTRYSDRPSSG